MAGFVGFLPKVNRSESKNYSEVTQPMVMNSSKINNQFASHSEKSGVIIGGWMESNQTSQDSTSTILDEQGNLLLFDGEISNIYEFLPELKTKGILERDFSEEEILFYLLIDYGTDVLPRLNGAFAFALYLKEKNQLFLGRDRLGEKNLFWALSEDGLIFSTEIHLIFKYGFPKKLNLGHLDELFFYKNISGPNTIFKGVNRVLPGHVQIWNDFKRQFTTDKWFDLSKEILTFKSSSNSPDWIGQKQNDSFNNDAKTQKSCRISSSGSQIIGLSSQASAPHLRLKEINVIDNELEFAFELIDTERGIQVLKKKISSFDFFQSLIQWMKKSSNPNLDLDTLVLSNFFKDSEIKFTHALVDIGHSSLFPNQRKASEFEIVFGSIFLNWLKSIFSAGSKNDEFHRLKKIKSFRNVDFQLMTFSNNFFISDLRKLGLRSLNLIPDYRLSILEEAKHIFPRDRLRQLSYLELFTEEMARNERWEQLGKESGITVQKPFLDFRLVIEALSLNNSSWQNRRNSPADYYSNNQTDLDHMDWKQVFLKVPEFRNHLEKMHESPIFKQGWLNFIDVSFFVKEFIKDSKSTYDLIEFLFLLSIWYHAQFES